MRFVYLDSRFTLHASSPRAVALAQLRFTCLAVASSAGDLHPEDRAHAGRTSAAGLVTRRVFATLNPPPFRSNPKGRGQSYKIAGRHLSLSARCVGQPNLPIWASPTSKLAPRLAPARTHPQARQAPWQEGFSRQALASADLVEQHMLNRYYAGQVAYADIVTT